MKSGVKESRINFRKAINKFREKQREGSLLPPLREGEIFPLLPENETYPPKNGHVGILDKLLSRLNSLNPARKKSNLERQLLLLDGENLSLKGNSACTFMDVYSVFYNVGIHQLNAVFGGSLEEIFIYFFEEGKKHELKPKPFMSIDILKNKKSVLDLTSFDLNTKVFAYNSEKVQGLGDDKKIVLSCDHKSKSTYDIRLVNEEYNIKVVNYKRNNYLITVTDKEFNPIGCAYTIKIKKGKTSIILSDIKFNDTKQIQEPHGSGLFFEIDTSLICEVIANQEAEFHKGRFKDDPYLQGNKITYYDKMGEHQIEPIEEVGKSIPDDLSESTKPAEKEKKVRFGDENKEDYDARQNDIKEDREKLLPEQQEANKEEVKRINAKLEKKAVLRRREEAKIDRQGRRKYILERIQRLIDNHFFMKSERASQKAFIPEAINSNNEDKKLRGCLKKGEELTIENDCEVGSDGLHTISYQIDGHLFKMVFGGQGGMVNISYCDIDGKEDPKKPKIDLNIGCKNLIIKGENHFADLEQHTNPIKITIEDELYNLVVFNYGNSNYLIANCDKHGRILGCALSIKKKKEKVVITFGEVQYNNTEREYKPEDGLEFTLDPSKNYKVINDLSKMEELQIKEEPKDNFKLTTQWNTISEQLKPSGNNIGQPTKPFNQKIHQTSQSAMC